MELLLEDQEKLEQIFKSHDEVQRQWIYARRKDATKEAKDALDDAMESHADLISRIRFARNEKPMPLFDKTAETNGELKSDGDSPVVDAPDSPFPADTTMSVNGVEVPRGQEQAAMDNVVENAIRKGRGRKAS